ncbi:PKD domain-containing protein, partial [Salibacteraceae bacterium]|nr:PKD domain-containing protein [Salibacteraceae bacterium]
MFRLLVILSLLISPMFSDASHLVGGEISYEQINGDTYVVSLRMYRDCYASGVNVATKFDHRVNISIYDASNNQLIRVLQIERPNDSLRLPLVVEVPCLPDPPDICILEIVYSDTLIINVPPNGLYLVNQRCCRTPDVLNFVNPKQFGSTYSTYIPGSNLYRDNSSPTFNEVPPIALCAGIYLNLDYSATDKDSDSLYYDLCTPYHGGGSNASLVSSAPDTPAAPPFDTISWKNSFDKNYQISSSPAFEIDHSTGIISGRPDQLGTYAFAVCVTEYRHGLKLSENKRDFQMEVTPCDVEAAAAIDSAVEECIGLQIQFYNKSTLGKYFYWDFGDLSTTIDTSSKSNPTYTYPDTGFYTIRLIAVGET